MRRNRVPWAIAVVFKGQAYIQSDSAFPSALEESRVLFSKQKQNLGDRITNLTPLKYSPGANKVDSSVKPQRAELKSRG